MFLQTSLRCQHMNGDSERSSSCSCFTFSNIARQLHGMLNSSWILNFFAGISLPSACPFLLFILLLSSSISGLPFKVFISDSLVYNSFLSSLYVLNCPFGKFPVWNHDSSFDEKYDILVDFVETNRLMLVLVDDKEPEAHLLRFNLIKFHSSGCCLGDTRSLICNWFNSNSSTSSQHYEFYSAFKWAQKKTNILNVS